MDDELSQFLTHARERGLDYSTARDLLRSAGWRDVEIASTFASQTLNRPVPEPRAGTSGRVAFLHAVAFAALYTWVVSLVYLLFRSIDLAFPDPAQDDWWRDRAHSTIRNSLASIVVSFPLFAVLWRKLQLTVQQTPKLGRSRIRRGGIWLALFVGAQTILVDAIVLVRYFLEGELTLRFVLKVVVLLVVAGGVCLYLVATLRSEAKAGQ